MEEVPEFFGEMAKIPGVWGTAGPAAAILALVMLLIRLTKVPAIANAMKIRPWVRPIVAALLGGLAGALTALTQELPWLQIAGAFVMGAISGFAATGVHQAVTGATANARTEALAVEAAKEVIKREDVEVIAAVNASPAAVELAAASNVENVKGRLDALAEWGRKHLPASGAGKIGKAEVAK